MGKIQFWNKDISCLLFIFKKKRNFRQDNSFDKVSVSNNDSPPHNIPLLDKLLSDIFFKVKIVDKITSNEELFLSITYAHSCYIQRDGMTQSLPMVFQEPHKESLLDRTSTLRLH